MEEGELTSEPYAFFVLASSMADASRLSRSPGLMWRRSDQHSSGSERVLYAKQDL